MFKYEMQSTKLPIQVGEFQMYFDMSDASIKGFYEKSKELEAKYKEVVQTGEELAHFEVVQSALKDGLDSMFGVGTFEQLHGMMPSTIMLLDCYFAIVTYVAKEIEKHTKTGAKIEKYLQG